jgi:hypothetical protein
MTESRRGSPGVRAAGPVRFGVCNEGRRGGGMQMEAELDSALDVS